MYIRTWFCCTYTRN